MAKVNNTLVIIQAGRRLDSAPSANVVAMATRLGPPGRPLGRPKHIRSIWHTSRLIGDFVQNSPNLPRFRSHGNKGRPHNILYGSIESAIPENPLVGPIISGVSAVQADLWAILREILGSKF